MKVEFSLSYYYLQISKTLFLVYFSDFSIVTLPSNLKLSQTFSLLDETMTKDINSLSPNLTKLSKTLKQVIGNLPTNFLSVFDYFVGLALNGLKLVESLCNSEGFACDFFI